MVASKKIRYHRRSKISISYILEAVMAQSTSNSYWIKLHLILHVLLFFQYISQEMGGYKYQPLSMPTANTFPHCFETAAGRNMRVTKVQSINQYGNK